MVQQLAWLLGGLVLLWFLMLNASADRFLCRMIGRVLLATTILGKRRYHRLLQVGAGYSVCEHPIGEDMPIGRSDLDRLGLTPLAVRTASGELYSEFSSSSELGDGDVLILYGIDAGHEALWSDAARDLADKASQ